MVELTINFVIIGGGIAGLTAALALSSVGHKVTVIEKRGTLEQGTEGGIRMAPNFSKILYHWGLEQEVKKIAATSRALRLYIYETGELLGEHIWDTEVLKETKGEFLTVHYSALLQLLYDVAISRGTEIRFNTLATSVDPVSGRVTLHSGEVLQGDVVVGADGPSGITRRVFPKSEERPSGMSLFSATIHRNSIINDPDLDYLYDEPVTMANWCGNGYSSALYPTGGDSDYSMLVFGPTEEPSLAACQDIQDFVSTADERLRKLARMATSFTYVPIIDCPLLDEWVSGRLVVIGDAAHPVLPGAVQSYAMCAEDGATLGRLFSHLHSSDQIPIFLEAFQDLRHSRCSFVMQREKELLSFLTLPPGEEQIMRDETMRAKRDAGLSVLSAADALNTEEAEWWLEIKHMFSYDAEDDADNWWVQWGILRLRANGVALGGRLEVFQSTSKGFYESLIPT
ncbi:FAD/NAD(P)-binding domain-containing protein [Guyanagaster necrorhizus]|uniref:FAD/NAD(P)-binding domain-containing protein n=1 Tax=Guyanagaster necrorhizus TaxID=856835 RepID=A0A9P7VXN8_9AGAR|nr:FAD/NAD(P)-binding domain-containing protein [Guyanagaster necrorhizus MCA 3950]KAG7448109.1 FAD/NAD(P)-binding domain-containing protein [Guyanagaster necrorhizus MCA 3950]